MFRGHDGRLAPLREDPPPLARAKRGQEARAYFSSVLPSTKAPSQGKAPSSRLWLGALPSRPVAMPARLCALSQRGFPFRGLLRAKPT